MPSFDLYAPDGNGSTLSGNKPSAPSYPPSKRIRTPRTTPPRAPVTPADILQALASLDALPHNRASKAQPAPSASTPPAETTAATTASTSPTTSRSPASTIPAPNVNGQRNAYRREGADPTENGSIRDRELPPGLPPAPPPSTAPAPATMRRRRDGTLDRMAAGAHQRQVVAYGSSPALHPDTGAPLAPAAAGGRRADRWDALPAIDRRKLRLQGDDTAKPSRVALLRRRLTAYAASCAVAT